MTKMRKITSLRRLKRPCKRFGANWIIDQFTSTETLLKNRSSFLYGRKPSGAVPIYTVIKDCAASVSSPDAASLKAAREEKSRRKGSDAASRDTLQTDDFGTMILTNDLPGKGWTSDSGKAAAEVSLHAGASIEFFSSIRLRTISLLTLIRLNDYLRYCFAENRWFREKEKEREQEAALSRDLLDVLSVQRGKGSLRSGSRIFW